MGRQKVINRLVSTSRRGKPDTCESCTKIPSEPWFCTDRCMVTPQHSHERVRLWEHQIKSLNVQKVEDDEPGWLPPYDLRNGLTADGHGVYS